METIVGTIILDLLQKLIGPTLCLSLSETNQCEAVVL